MYRPTFLLLSVLLFSTSLHSNAQSVYFGVEPGASYTRFLYKDISSTTFFFDRWDRIGKESGSIMVFALIPVESTYAWQIGLRYHAIGNTLNYSPRGGTLLRLPFKENITQRYVSLPLRVRSALINNSLFYVIGAEFSYLLSVNYDRFPGLDYTYSLRDDLKKTNIALLEGLGYQFKVNQRQMYFQILYQHGMQNVARPISEGWHTQEFNVSAGYLFN